MKKTLLTLVIILSLIVASAGAWFYFSGPQIEDSTSIPVSIATEKTNIITPSATNDIINQEDATPLPTPSQPPLQYSQEIKTYTGVALNFENTWDKTISLSVFGGAVIDIDSDGDEEIFISGGANQKDALFDFVNGEIINRIDETDISRTEPSYGVVSIDLNNDNQADLLVARNSGVYLYTNNNGVFTEEKIDIAFEKDTVPIDIAVGDIDNDGDADLYISTFVDQKAFRSAVFNDEQFAKPNIFLENNNGVFTDKTEEVGLSLRSNTFVSSFADIDNDGWDDLVVSPNTDSVKIYKNNEGVFSLAESTKELGFWMGLAITDSNNDGYLDMFFSNTGKSIPVKLLQGDTRADQNVVGNYTFIEGNPELVLENSIAEYDADIFSFGWGIIPIDIDNNNVDDFLVEQNYVKWPAHNLKKLTGSVLRSESGTFTEVIEQTGLDNPYYGLSALKLDFNDDGIEDLVHLNLNGPSRIMIANPSLNNSVSIAFPDSINAYGAEVKMALGNETIVKRHLPKQGLLTDQSSIMRLSMGNQTAANITVTMRDGNVYSFPVTETNVLIDLSGGD